MVKKNNIKYILNIGSNSSCDSISYYGEELEYMNKINYIKFEKEDKRNVLLTDIFEDCFKLIDEAIKSSSCILIHCAAGISRSATIVLAYLMSREKLSFNKAFSFVKMKRSCINPNRIH